MTGLLSFSEYQSRIASASPAKSAATVLWNGLCRLGLSVLGRDSTVVDYTVVELPKDWLIRLKPEMLSKSVRILPQVLELYKVLHKSLQDDLRQIKLQPPRFTCRCSGKISKEALMACTGWGLAFTARTWNSLLRWTSSQPDVQLNAQGIAKFCSAAEKGLNKGREDYIAHIAAPNLAKLRTWAFHIRQR